MNELPIILIYKTINRDLLPLKRACQKLRLSLHVCENQEQLQRELETSLVTCIIVPLGSKEESGNQATEFATMIGEFLRPEDSDLEIIYSTETTSPNGWHKVPDPKVIRRYYDYHLPRLCTEDLQWVNTVNYLKSLTLEDSYGRNRQRTIVKIGFASDKPYRGEVGNVPFSTEAGFLLRAAFKDMSRIEVHTPRQGLSGSRGYIIQPFDSAGNETKKFFAKIFPEQGKAIKEYQNFREHVSNYFLALHYPNYNYPRRYSGIGLSLFVTDLVVGPNGVSTSLREMVQSPIFSVKQLTDFFSEALSIMDQHWHCRHSKEALDLVEAYLNKFLKDEMKRAKLDSDNYCHKWFGKRVSDVPFEGKLRSSFPTHCFAGTNLKICHGDLHLDNIMAGHFGGKLIPVFIDFSRTGETHSLNDLVTLESDLIIRCLNGAKYEAEKFQSFLESLSFKVQSDNHQERENLGIDELLEIEKVRAISKLLRKNAISLHGASEVEYYMAALLKTLEVLSYGQLPNDENERAAAYVTYLCERIRRLSKA